MYQLLYKHLKYFSALVFFTLQITYFIDNPGHVWCNCSLKTKQNDHLKVNFFLAEFLLVSFTVSFWTKPAHWSWLCTEDSGWAVGRVRLRELEGRADAWLVVGTGGAQQGSALQPGLCGAAVRTQTHWVNLPRLLNWEMLIVLHIERPSHKQLNRLEHWTINWGSEIYPGRSQVGFGPHSFLILSLLLWDNLVFRRFTETLSLRIWITAEKTCSLYIQLIV